MTRMTRHLTATLVAAVLLAATAGVATPAHAVRAERPDKGDYYTISVSDNGGHFREIWSGDDPREFPGYSSASTKDFTALAPTQELTALTTMAAGSNSCEYMLEHKNVLGQTLYTLSNSLSWSWTSSGVCTITSRHYHHSAFLSWSWVHLENSASGYGYQYCYGKYKGHFYWTNAIWGATAYPGLNVRGNAGGTHSSSTY